jgi:putative ABC transport system permease protein
VGKRLGGMRNMPAIEVVGVVADVRAEDATRTASPEVYLPASQAPPPRIALAVRADPRVYRDAAALEIPLRQAVSAAAPGQAVTHIAAMRGAISDRIAPQRLSAQLIAIFAGLALALAAVGIYGVMSFSVAQRTHEIGVRFALGAGRGRLLAAIVGRAAMLAAAGVALGLAASVALLQVLKSLLFGVPTLAPLIYAAAGVALIAIAMLAALAPALRALRVDPAVALRHE